MFKLNYSKYIDVAEKTDSLKDVLETENENLEIYRERIK